ncbi:MAG TPA: ribbon-helix-helix domain-containing protein [Sulfolobales archaeon]|nr:ribbon-helix-helix domain-containing protein [Sulfolobales archaeon]
MTIIVRKVSSESFELNVRIPRIVSIKLEQGTLRMLDDAWKKAGYRSRSDFIRDAIKIYMELLEEIARREAGASGIDRTKVASLREELLKIVLQKNIATK